jgi:DNA repair protein RecO (recombination protein O)
MQICSPAIIVAARAHGEHGAIVRALTADFGLLSGYVRGGKSRRLKPILSVGNIVAAEFRARREAQLASLTVELTTARTPLLTEPLAAAAIEWVTALAAVTLPEGHPYPRLYDALDGILSAIEAAPSARGWVMALERYESLLLTELGYGDDTAEGLTSNGRRLSENLLTERRADILPARDRLIERIDRAMGR